MENKEKDTAPAADRVALSGEPGRGPVVRERRYRRKVHAGLVRLRRRRLRQRRFVLSLFVAVCALVGLWAAEELRPESAAVERAVAPVTGERLLPPAPDGDLEARIRAIAEIYPGEFGVVVRDPRTGETAGLNPDQTFTAASLAKLPVLLALYGEAADGRLDLEEKIVMEAQDVQLYGAGVLQNYPVGHEMTLRECAELLIKESDNTAWVMLERRLGRERIEHEIESLKLSGTDYAALTTTPEDVLRMLEAIADPDHTTPELSAEMLAYMTDTAYERRIPEPLPKDVRVAHKVGTLNDTRSDAAIVFRQPGDKVDYMIVVIASGGTERSATDAIRRISLSAYEAL